MLMHRSLLGGRRGALICISNRNLMKEVRNSIGINVSAVIESAKGTIFGLMAKNMNEKDINKFFSHWNHRLDDTTPSSASPVVSSAVVNSTKSTPVTVESKPVESNTYVPIMMPEIASPKFLFHPLLGELVSDIGYKKLYLTNVHALARTPVWKRQRILRPERAALIADDKVRKGLQGSLPGVITLYQDIHTSEVGIIDGQHRAGALMILAQRGHWEERKNNIAIEVFTTDGEASVAALFAAINAAEPVRLIDLPDSGSEEDDEVEGESESITATPTQPEPVVSNSKVPENSEKLASPTISTSNILEEQNIVAKSKPSSKPKKNVTVSLEADRTLITEAMESVRQQYPDMFKPTSRCKIPHVNIDVLRDDLFNASVLRVRRFASVLEFVAQLQLINGHLKVKYAQLASEKDVDKEVFTKSFQTALAKAQKYEFYLGDRKSVV